MGRIHLLGIHHKTAERFGRPEIVCKKDDCKTLAPYIKYKIIII